MHELGLLDFEVCRAGHGGYCLVPDGGFRVSEMCCGTEAGSYLRLIDSCITQLTAHGPSRTYNESKEEEEEVYELGLLDFEVCRAGHGGHCLVPGDAGFRVKGGPADITTDS